MQTDDKTREDWWKDKNNMVQLGIQIATADKILTFYGITEDWLSLKFEIICISKENISAQWKSELERGIKKRQSIYTTLMCKYDNGTTIQIQCRLKKYRECLGQKPYKC